MLKAWKTPQSPLKMSSIFQIYTFLSQQIPTKDLKTEPWGKKNKSDVL